MFDYRQREFYVGRRSPVGAAAPSFADWLSRVHALDWQRVPRWKRAQYYGDYRVDCVANGYSYENPKLYYLDNVW